MQISTSAPPATVPAPATAASSSATSAVPAINPGDNAAIVQWKQLAAILADSSTASLDDKVKAYIGMTKLFLTANQTGGLADLSKSDAAALDDIWHNSSVSQQIAKAADDFNAKGMSLVGQIKTVNIAGVLNDAFNQMSDVDQMMVYAGTASPTQYSFDGFKQELQQSADYEAGTLADAAKPAVTVSLSDDAKAALGGPTASDDSDGAKQAIKTLTAAKAGVSKADVALAVLQQASEAKAKSDATVKAETKATVGKTDAKTSPQTGKPYLAGDMINTTA